MILQNIWKRKKQDILFILLFLLTYFLFILLFLDSSIELIRAGFYQEANNLFVYLAVVASLSNSFNGFSLNYHKVKMQLSFGLNRKKILFQTINRVIWIFAFLLLILFLHNIYLVLLSQKLTIFPFSLDTKIIVYLFALYLFLSGLGFALGILGSNEKIFLYWMVLLFIVSILGLLLFQSLLWVIALIMFGLSFATFTWGAMHFYKKKF